MKKFSTTLKFTIYGSLFGLCFPLLGMWITAIDLGVSYLESQLVGNSLLLINDTAPLVLGFFGYLIGKRQQFLEDALKEQSQKKEGPDQFPEESVISKKILAQSVGVFLILIAASWSLGLYLNKIREINLDRTLTKLSDVQFSNSVRSIENMMQAMDRLADRFSRFEGEIEESWKIDSQTYLEDFKIFQAIEWADQKGIVRYVNPLQGNEKALNLDLTFEEHRKIAMEKSLLEGKGQFSSPINLVQGGIGVLSFHPTKMIGAHSGFIIGVYKLGPLFEKYLKPNFAYSVQVGDQIVYESENFNKELVSQSQKFKVRNFNFVTNFHPSQQLIAENKDIFETTFVLTLLFLVSGILTFLFYSLQSKKYNLYLSREKIRETTKENARISEMIQSVFNNAQGVIYRCDPNENWTMRYINHQVEKLTGFPADDFIEDKVRSYASVIHPEDVDYVDHVVGVGVENKVSFDMDYRIVTKEGEIRHVHERGVPLFDEQGNCHALDGFIVDISEKRELEEQLEQEKVKSLQNAKLATLGEMAAGIAHEINNPLSIISNSIELMIKKEQKAEVDNKSIKKITKSVERMSKIVKGLKKFSRRTDEVVREESSLQLLVTECIDLTIVKSNQKEVPILLEPFDDVTVICDDIQTEQVLINLINNAIDACSENDDKWVKIIVEECDSQTIDLIVVDAGKGINKDNVKQMFNPFFTTKAQSLGTGLGLSISKNIANEQGGDLVYKERDGNTAFVFSIPKAS